MLAPQSLPVRGVIITHVHPLQALLRAPLHFVEHVLERTACRARVSGEIENATAIFMGLLNQLVVIIFITSTTLSVYSVDHINGSSSSVSCAPNLLLTGCFSLQQPARVNTHTFCSSATFTLPHACTIDAHPCPGSFAGLLCIFQTLLPSNREDALIL